MVVQESDILLAALDRRLQVDRITSLDPLTAIGRAPDQSRAPPGGATPAPIALTGGDAVSPQAASTVTSAWAARLPLGSIIHARVTAVPQPDHVVAEVDSLRIELAWPAANGTTPAPGSDVALRVIAHTPMLLFQRPNAADAAAARSVRADASATRWSSDAIRLQMATPTTDSDARTNASGPIRFDAPILEIAIEPIDPRTADDQMPSNRREPGPANPATLLSSQSPAPGRSPSTIASQPGGPPQPQSQPAPSEGRPPPMASQPYLPQAAQSQSQALSFDLSSMAEPATLDRSTPIALDDVVVARHTAFVDGVATPLFARDVDEARPVTVPFSPLVLQGPAWPGQPVEVVVRRERDDAQFDNPVLDHWCGEVQIDLPNLGRVAAHLSFSMKGLKLRIEGDDSTSVDAMTGAAPALASALSGADLRVATLTIAQPASDALRPADHTPAAASVAFRRSTDG